MKNWVYVGLLAFWGMNAELSAQSNLEVKANDSDVVTIIEVVTEGLVRTNRDWLLGYLNLDQLPRTMTKAELGRIPSVILTTAVFSDAEVQIEPGGLDKQSVRLRIFVKEKWTTIPVIRGVFGGGTPLLVLGGYDTHTLGRLWTLGLEARKYGDASPGFVAYFRDPRAFGGRFFFGAEFWRNIRIRSLYTRNGTRLGEVLSDAKIARAQILAPFSLSSAFGSDWKYGLDLKQIEKPDSRFLVDHDENPRLSEVQQMTDRLDLKGSQQTRILPTFVYDDVKIDNILMDGLRGIVRYGPLIKRDKTYTISEGELFYYHLLPSRQNLALHLFAGQSGAKDLPSQYFLGGFDSVRGLPDGIIFGNRAAYANFEYRHISAKAKYLWVQSVIFADTGGAGQDWQEVRSDRRTAAGVGLRFAVPQVYRLMFRIDYARSLDGSGTEGISAGMNHFFQPYRPL